MNSGHGGKVSTGLPSGSLPVESTAGTLTVSSPTARAASFSSVPAASSSSSCAAKSGRRSLACCSASSRASRSRASASGTVVSGSILLTRKRCRPNALSTGSLASPSESAKIAVSKSAGRSPLLTVPSWSRLSPSISAATCSNVAPAATRSAACSIGAGSAASSCSTVRRSGVRNSSMRLWYAASTSSSPISISSSRSSGFRVMKVSDRYSGAVNCA